MKQVVQPIGDGNLRGGRGAQPHTRSDRRPGRDPPFPALLRDRARCAGTRAGRPPLESEGPARPAQSRAEKRARIDRIRKTVQTVRTRLDEYLALSHKAAASPSFGRHSPGVARSGCRAATVSIAGTIMIDDHGNFAVDDKGVRLRPTGNGQVDNLTHVRSLVRHQADRTANLGTSLAIAETTLNAAGTPARFPVTISNTIRKWNPGQAESQR